MSIDAPPVTETPMTSTQTILRAGAAFLSAALAAGPVLAQSD